MLIQYLLARVHVATGFCFVPRPLSMQEKGPDIHCLHMRQFICKFHLKNNILDTRTNMWQNL